MKKKGSLNEIKVKSFVTDVENENKLKGGNSSGYACLTFDIKASICFDHCDQK